LAATRNRIPTWRPGFDVFSPPERLLSKLTRDEPDDTVVPELNIDPPTFRVNRRLIAKGVKGTPGDDSSLAPAELPFKPDRYFPT
jgi:hypothetical protein